MTQIFVTSTLYGAVAVSAAVDAGLFGERGRRRILLVSNNAAIPELAVPVDQAPGFEVLAPRFDEVRSWNEEIAPLHPGGWLPRTEELPLWERVFRERWELGGDPLEIVVESVSASPARTIASIFHDAEVTVYSEGLMSYGPTRTPLPNAVGTQITRQLHLNLVPGLEPQLLREHEVPAEAIPEEPFRAVLDKLGAHLAPLVARHREHDGDLDGAALVVGQYLAALDLLTEDEEQDLHLTMLRGVAARGHATVLFKPHPGSPARSTARLAAEAERLGVRLVVIDAPVPAEVWCGAVRPELIVGCFSTALVTASRFYGIPAAAVGSTPMLKRLTPYHNSNRIPVTVIDTMLPHLEADGTLHDPLFRGEGAAAELNGLVKAVSYCMRASARPDLREDALAFLHAHPGEPWSRYFTRRRLTSLDLPGGFSTAHPKVLNAVLPRSSRRRQIAVSVFRRTEQLRAKARDGS
ncbi:MAG TPA: alpha-2,8-polysialyltransferase family protein [Thermomonospora sp.]|nr:alpha-2,8-polysialyltransferase family protein [Thermomonospora sp.]